MKLIYQFMIGRSVRAVILFRISSFFYNNKLKVIGQLFWSLNLMLHSLEISPKAKIGKKFVIAHTPGIVIGGGTIIGNNVKIYQNVTLGVDKNKKYPIVCDGVTIYPGAVIIGGIKIGEGATIGANAFVNKNVEAHSVVVGVPARPLKSQGDRS